MAAPTDAFGAFPKVRIQWPGFVGIEDPLSVVFPGRSRCGGLAGVLRSCRREE